ncbi:MAG TPA: carboxypeptidase-like regulatory domain-containing protein [Bryobacteraceae bacterium]|nr:carboxypeptidase-like regulatory domain-containing protein [Bryobacteraceae bacterium]
MRKPKLFLISSGRLLPFLGLFASLAVWGQQVSGRVTANAQQPVAGALVKVQARGGVQTIVSTTGADGTFSASGIKTDEALVSVEKDGVLLFRAIVSTKSGEPMDISLPQPFHLSGWHPADLAADPAQGVLVVDTGGGVWRIRNDAQGPHRDVLFQIPLGFSISSITAGEGVVFVTTNPATGCTVFRFTIANRSTDRKVLSLSETCSGIAVAGSAIYVAFSQSKEVRRWDNWDSTQPKGFGVNNDAALGSLLFDKQGQRLLVADRDGRLYAMPLAGGKATQLTSGAGWIASLAADSNHILMASGKKIVMIARSDNHGEKDPPALTSLTGGTLAGLAFDSAGNLWYADYSNGTVSGPLIFR